LSTKYVSRSVFKRFKNTAHYSVYVVDLRAFRTYTVPYSFIEFTKAVNATATLSSITFPVPVENTRFIKTHLTLSKTYYRVRTEI